jgi:hypothetical protein
MLPVAALVQHARQCPDAKISSYTSANLPIHSSYQVAQAILDWDKDKGREDKDTGDATMECYVQL